MKLTLKALTALTTATALFITGCTPAPSNGPGPRSKSHVPSTDEVRNLIFGDGNKPTMRTVEIVEYGANNDTGLVKVRVVDSYHLPENMDSMFHNNKVREEAHNESMGIKSVDDPAAGKEILIRPVGLKGLTPGDCGFDDAMAEAKKLRPGFYDYSSDLDKQTPMGWSIRSVVPDNPQAGVNYDPLNTDEPLAVNFYMDRYPLIGQNLINAGDVMLLGMGIAFANGEDAGFGFDVDETESKFSLKNLHQPVLEAAKKIAPTGYNVAANGFYQSKTLAMTDHYANLNNQLKEGLLKEVKRKEKEYYPYRNGSAYKYESKPTPENEGESIVRELKSYFNPKIGAYKSCEFPAEKTLPKPIAKWSTEADGSEKLTPAERMTTYGMGLAQGIDGTQWRTLVYH